MQMAIEEGRITRPSLEVGISGEHGGDPESIEWCHLIGNNYVSCSPFRVPIARLAAGQAALKYRLHSKKKPKAFGAKPAGKKRPRIKRVKPPGPTPLDNVHRLAEGARLYGPPTVGSRQLNCSCSESFAMRDDRSGQGCATRFNPDDRWMSLKQSRRQSLGNVKTDAVPRGMNAAGGCSAGAKSLQGQAVALRGCIGRGASSAG
jgi:hypothetical protein